MISTLRGIDGLEIQQDVPLSKYTRFGFGGPANALVDASSETALAAAMEILPEGWSLIGGGSNLIVSDDGFPGTVLRYTAKSLHMDGNSVWVEAGAVLQDLVDATIEAGLKGLETMTGIPGWVGGAIYGNAGAYGHSIHERVECVRYFDESGIREIGNRECQFRYRESVFKREKGRVILAVRLVLEAAHPPELASTAAGILKIRNEKYPPTMRCAGSIFKNLLLEELPSSVQSQVPEGVIREGKVPSAYFLEQVGAKGMELGGIRVADYHANLLYNSGTGTAWEAKTLIRTLKNRVREAYGLVLEEEVQYVCPEKKPS